MQNGVIYVKGYTVEYIGRLTSEVYSSVFTPIVRRSDCVSRPMVFGRVYSCCDAGESGGEMCAL
jgi:hypothetical protein